MGLNFEFLDSASGQRIVLPRTYVSLFDFDQMPVTVCCGLFLSVTACYSAWPRYVSFFDFDQMSAEVQRECIQFHTADDTSAQYYQRRAAHSALALHSHPHRAPVH